MTTRLAFLGGVYSNYLALEATIADAKKWGADQIFCLGDLGAFGPYPDRVFPLLDQFGIPCVQGNYDDSIGRGLDDCQCGYTDPRDNHFAAISYRYTLENTSAENREFLRGLPSEIRLEVEGRRVVLCHGSPRRTNEFLWQSTTSTPFLEYLLEEAQVDLVIGTHTGLPWQRPLSGGRHFVNCGAIGRPANDGQTCVWYARVELEQGRGPKIEFVPVTYDHRRLANEMRDEGLPEEFIETILTGWWTTCLEVLPGKERAAGVY
ncbi:MAG: metallophosphoesterase family protein [Pirellulaceae bacterium]